jgi:ABC-type sugar transport system ATPase subunit
MLEFRSISKSFPGVHALKDVSFAVEAGEVHALMGENGAGKSTLMNVLSGAITDYTGEILLDGKPLVLHQPRDAQKAGVAIIHQELQLVPELTIAENIFLGRELHTPTWRLDRRRMAREAREYLGRLHLDVDPARPVKGLRVGEQQLVEIAKALSLNARILILDEPTSALNQTEIRFLFETIGLLKAAGVTMIYISHKFEETFRIADRVTILRDGEYIGTRNVRETSQDELIQMMVGRSIKDLFPKERIQLGEEVLRVRDLHLHAQEKRGERGLHDISFSLRKGEIVGVAGLLGAGRTELLQTLFGVYPRKRVQGSIQIEGRERRFDSPMDAIAAGVAFVTEDRKNQSLIMQSSVAHNITLAALRNFLHFGLLRQQQERQAVRRSVSQLRIKTPNITTEVATLSGGNQQKVVLAKGLLIAPRVLLLDEPTRGIDVGAKAEIYTLISQLAKEGAAILLASSEMPELLAMCDRILVLSEGRLTAEFARGEVTQEQIMRAAMQWHEAQRESQRQAKSDGQKLPAEAQPGSHSNGSEAPL